VDANNCLNGIFSLLINSLNSEFISGFRLIDNFSSCFFFHQAYYKDKESKTAYLCKFDDIFAKMLLDSKSVVVVSNASIKNNIAMSISYVYSYSNNIKKTIYHAVNVTLTEAELFCIECEIN